VDATRPGRGGIYIPDYLRHLTLARDEGHLAGAGFNGIVITCGTSHLRGMSGVGKGRAKAAIDGSRNGSTGSAKMAQFLAAANKWPVFQTAVETGGSRHLVCPDKGTVQIPAKIYAKGFWAVLLALKVVSSDLRLRKKGMSVDFGIRDV
jgi:hypothetical protein